MYCFLVCNTRLLVCLDLDTLVADANAPAGSEIRIHSNYRILAQTGLLVAFYFRQKLKKSRTQIYMDLSYIDHTPRPKGPFAGRRGE